MPRFALLLAAVVLTPSYAADVYKCTNPAGALAFQDHPCANGDSETQVHIAPPPPDSAEAPPAAATPADSPPPPTSPPSAAATPPSASREPPPMWLCTRPEDGRQYMSHSATSEVRMVPAGVLGMPGKTLGDAYGKNGGVGVSAPGVRQIPVDKTPQASVASDYVAVQDLCEQAPPEQVCTYLHDEYDRIRAKLRRAFKAEQAELEPQLADIQQQLDGC